MEPARKFFSTVSEIIEYSEIPKSKTWALIPLYKIDKIGNLRIWQIGFDGSELNIQHGPIKNDNLQFDYVEIIPKSNRTLQEQALLEARSRYTETYREDLYRPNGTPPPDNIQPELANKYEIQKIKYWPVATMPKIDGIRARFKLNGDNLVILSRNNKPMTNLGFLEEE